MFANLLQKYPKILSLDPLLGAWAGSPELGPPGWVRGLALRGGLLVSGASHERETSFVLHELLRGRVHAARFVDAGQLYSISFASSGARALVALERELALVRLHLPQRAPTSAQVQALIEALTANAFDNGNSWNWGNRTTPNKS